jgi:predicted metal-binding membrane protein
VILHSLEAPALAARDRIVIWSAVIALLVLAWGYLIVIDRQMSAMADGALQAEMLRAMAQPWQAADMLFTFAMWMVMMVGMMVGPAAPILLLFAATEARHGRGRITLAVLLFGLGYLTIWLGFSGWATVALWALHDAGLLSPMMAASNPRLSGIILLGAGVYQLTPLKSACLAHCRSPLGFLMTHWRDGRGGALRMGLAHGVYCLGCCWALMCVLFVVGVMNLLWVAALTLFVLLEKVGPAPAFIARATGVALVAAGVWFLIAA